MREGANLAVVRAILHVGATPQTPPSPHPSPSSDLTQNSDGSWRLRTTGGDALPLETSSPVDANGSHSPVAAKPTLLGFHVFLFTVACLSHHHLPTASPFQGHGMSCSRVRVPVARPHPPTTVLAYVNGLQLSGKNVFVLSLTEAPGYFTSSKDSPPWDDKIPGCSPKARKQWKTVTWFTLPPGSLTTSAVQTAEQALYPAGKPPDGTALMCVPRAV